MKNFLMLFTLLFALGANGGTTPTPRAIARICGNVVVSAKHIKIAKAAARREGCEEIRTVPLSDDYFLVYGIKELIGESDFKRPSSR